MQAVQDMPTPFKDSTLSCDCTSIQMGADEIVCTGVMDSWGNYSAGGMMIRHCGWTLIQSVFWRVMRHLPARYEMCRTACSHTDLTLLWGDVCHAAINGQSIDAGFKLWKSSFPTVLETSSQFYLWVQVSGKKIVVSPSSCAFLKFSALTHWFDPLNSVIETFRRWLPAYFCLLRCHFFEYLRMLNN